MISDVLSQAVHNIRRYLTPDYPLRYIDDPEFMVEIEALLTAMDGLRRKLDTGGRNGTRPSRRK